MQARMKIISAVFGLCAVTLALFACAHKEQPVSTGPSMPPKGTLLVQQLPASAEGLELKDGYVKLKPGYKYEPKGPAGFVIARMDNGKGVATGGCGCADGVCGPKLDPSGIIVCDKQACASCGLALTVGGVRTTIIRF